MASSPDLAANHARAEAGVRACAAQGAHVVCLQELFASPYFCQTEEHRHFELAEAIPGPTAARFAALAKELAITLILPVFERRAAGIYHNSALVLDTQGGIAGHYRKMHIPDDPGFLEKFYFTPGDLGFVAVPTRHGNLGILICWDQWFPEAARLTAMAGAEILFYPTAIGWCPGERETAARYAASWQTVQRGHAVANGVFVAAVNRVGLEVPPGGGHGLEFWGRSFVAGPSGEILAEAPAYAADNLVVTCDLALVEQTRREWPFFRDRRIDAYSALTQRFGTPGDGGR